MSLPVTEPDFVTDRLRVFRFNIKSDELQLRRAVFLAFHSEEEISYPIVTATVWVNGPYVGHLMEMIATHDEYRREGFAKELWLAVENHLDGIVTPDSQTEKSPGAALVSAIAMEHQRLGRTVPDLNDPVVQEKIRLAYLEEHGVTE